MWWADNSVKSWHNLTFCNPKADLHNTNAHTKFGENPLTFTQVMSGNESTVVWWADNSVKNLLNLPISNPKSDLYNIKAHTKFGENPLTFTQVIVCKGKYGHVPGR